MRIAPDVRDVIKAGGASLLLIAVESGALTSRAAAPLVVTRAAAGRAAAGQAQELVARGAETALGPSEG